MGMSICVHGFPVASPAKEIKLKKYGNLISPKNSLPMIVKPFSVQRNWKPGAKKLPPICLSTNPSDVDTKELGALLRATHQNCDQFPEILDDGSVKPVDPRKLKLALLNSTVVVSIHTRGDIPYGDYMERIPEPQHSANSWLDVWWTRRRPKKRLVGFGRATSDCSLTASIYDLAVAPSLQRLGIGRKILQKIIRILTSRGIDDIAALCSEEQRLFFQACGFATDVLNSTTMIYSRNASYYNEIECAKYFGRKSLLIPAPLTSFSLKRK